MEDLYTKLETRLKALIQQCESLTVANSQLKQGKSTLIKEKEMLLEKNKIAVTQIEQMILRLKTLEQSS